MRRGWGVERALASGERLIARLVLGPRINKKGTAHVDQYLGEIRIFGGNFPPRDWAFCDGTLLSIAENDALFALIGTTYGGDGVTTFALPDPRGRALVHQGQNPRSGTSYPIGQRAGAEAVTLLSTQLPAHTHVVAGQGTEGTASAPSGALFAQSSSATYSNAAPTGTMAPNLVTASGGSQPHDNMMPYLALEFIISLQGIFPPRS